MTTPSDASVTGLTDHSTGAAGLSVSGLRFGYDAHTPVIDAVTANLSPGRLTVMVGPNAAGKTTLLRLMLGQLRPWSGSVRLDGQDVTAMPAADRARHIAYVPQRGSVSFAFTVREVVEMGRFAQTAAPRAVEEAIQRCDLTTVADRIFAQLSGGQQQRVLLARAMAQLAHHAGPGVLLADEPVSSMDLLHTHQTMAHLRQLAGEGLAVLVVMHDLTLAARYADDAWLVDGGRLLASGPWPAVLDPQVLAPVYRVALATVVPSGGGGGGDRPLFHVETQPLAGTMTSVTPTGSET